MKRFLSVILVLSMVSVLMSACGQKQSVSSAAPAASAAESKSGSSDPIIIGSVNDMSSSTSVLGNAIDRGAKLAVEKINTEGGVLGRQIKLISYDNKNDAQETINAYTRLADVDKAVATICPPGSTICLSLISISNQKKVPVLALPSDPRATVDAKTGKAYPYMFLVTQPNAIQQAHMMADFMFSEKKASKAAVFYDQSNSYSTVNATSFVDYWKQIGGTIVSNEMFKNGDQDVKTQLTKIKASGADFVYVPNTAPNLVLMAQQAAQVGFDIPYVGAMDMADPFLTLINDPSAVKSAYFESISWMQDTKLDDFNKAYKTKYGEAATVKSISGYDTVYIIKAAIEASGKADAESIRNGVENSVKNLPLLCSDSYTQDPKTHAPLNQAMIVNEIKDGKLSKWGAFAAKG
jgi:branched-chain amino acid transport system substrate-binding protein